MSIKGFLDAKSKKARMKWLLPLVAVLAALMLVGGVWAAVQFTLNVPSSGTVAPFSPSGGGGGGTGSGSYAIAVYAESGPTGVDTSVRLTNTASPGIAYGSITAGDSVGVTKYFYVVNIGNQPVIPSASVLGLPVDVTATVSGGGSSLEVGAGTNIAVTLKAGGTASVGDFTDVTTVFYGNS